MALQFTPPTTPSSSGGGGLDPQAPPTAHPCFSLATSATSEAVDLSMWRLSLQMGENLCAQDSHGKWYDAQIVEVKGKGEGEGGEKVGEGAGDGGVSTPPKPPTLNFSYRVRFLGWVPASDPGKYDETFTLPADAQRLLPVGTKIRKWRSCQVWDEVKLRRDSVVEDGVVLAVDSEKGEVAVAPCRPLPPHFLTCAKRCEGKGRRVFEEDMITTTGVRPTPSSSKVSAGAASAQKGDVGTLGKWWWVSVHDSMRLVCHATHRRSRLWGDVDTESVAEEEGAWGCSMGGTGEISPLIPGGFIEDGAAEGGAEVAADAADSSGDGSSALASASSSLSSSPPTAPLSLERSQVEAAIVALRIPMPNTLLSSSFSPSTSSSSSPRTLALMLHDALSPPSDPSFNFLSKGGKSGEASSSNSSSNSSSISSNIGSPPKSGGKVGGGVGSGGAGKKSPPSMKPFLRNAAAESKQTLVLHRFDAQVPHTTLLAPPSTLTGPPSTFAVVSSPQQSPKPLSSSFSSSSSSSVSSTTPHQDHSHVHRQWDGVTFTWCAVLEVEERGDGDYSGAIFSHACPDFSNPATAHARVLPWVSH